jgi:hypothetical protein
VQVLQVVRHGRWLLLCKPLKFSEIVTPQRAALIEGEVVFLRLTAHAGGLARQELMLHLSKLRHDNAVVYSETHHLRRRESKPQLATGLD